MLTWHVCSGSIVVNIWSQKANSRCLCQPWHTGQVFVYCPRVMLPTQGPYGGAINTAIEIDDFFHTRLIRRWGHVTMPLHLRLNSVETLLVRRRKWFAKWLNRRMGLVCDDLQTLLYHGNLTSNQFRFEMSQSHLHWPTWMMTLTPHGARMRWPGWWFRYK